jgi:hypothetical protein
MFFLLVLVRFVLRDARSNEREFSEIGNRVFGKSDEQFEPNQLVFGSSESEGCKRVRVAGDWVRVRRGRRFVQNFVRLVLRHGFDWRVTSGWVAE